MEALTSLLLALCCLCSAVLPYRQPHKLPDNAKTLAKLFAISCLFICSASVVSLFTQKNSVAQLMFDNLAYFLAVPLISSLLLSAYFQRFFKTATWGRFSLVLLATFEVCRRAEVGDAYALAIALIGSIALVTCLVLPKPENATKVSIKGAAAITWCSALVVFSPHSVWFEANILLYNLLLGSSLLAIGHILAKSPAMSVNH